MKRPRLYLQIHHRLYLRADANKEIEWNKLMSYMGVMFHIPKEERINIVRELEEMGLLKRLDKFKVKVL